MKAIRLFVMVCLLLIPMIGCNNVDQVPKAEPMKVTLSTTPDVKVVADPAVSTDTVVLTPTDVILKTSILDRTKSVSKTILDKVVLYRYQLIGGLLLIGIIVYSIRKFKFSSMKNAMKKIGKRKSK